MLGNPAKLAASLPSGYHISLQPGLHDGALAAQPTRAPPMRIDLATLREGDRPTRSARKRSQSWRRLLPVGLLILGALLPMLAADAIDAAMERRGWRPGEPRLAALQSWAGALTELEAADLPLLRLDLKFKKYQRLVDKRKAALSAGKLVVSRSDFVPGKIRIGDAAVDVVLRLQGSDLKNLQGEKWSLRVHARRGGHVLGVERFTLRSPEADGYLHKAAIYEHLRLAGVAAPRHHFVRLAINGTPIGIMSLEEYFSNELIAGQKRPEGPILRFGKGLLHASEEAAAESDDAEAAVVGLGALDNYRLAPVRMFRAKRTLRDPAQRAMALRAVASLRGFAAGELPAERVFDLPAMARLLAVCELWGAAEFLQWPNLRFYYNPMIERLEPIGYASQAEPSEAEFALVRRSALARDLLVSRPMRQAYVDALLAEARAVVDGARMAPITEHVTLWRHRIRAEYPMVRADLPVATRAQAVLAGHQGPAVSLLARRASRAGFQSTEARVRLANPLLVDVRVLAARWHVAAAPVRRRKGEPVPEARPARRLPAVQSGAVRLPLSLTSTAVDGAPSWTELRWSRPVGLPGHAELEFDVQVAGRKKSFAVLSEPELVAPTATHHPFDGPIRAWLRPVTGSPGYVVPAGRWRLERPLVLPAGHSLQLAPGCKLDLGPEGRIVVQGTFEAVATADAPIELRVAPAVGDQPAALTVARGGSATFEHVRISGADGGTSGRGLVLYETDLRMKHSQLVGITGPAAIHVARASLDIANSSFEAIADDGVLVEYGDGRITDSAFRSVGGDGIDIAGSRLTVERCVLEQVGDKAISVGEGSQADLSHLRVKGAAIGVAAKDSSRTTLRDSRFVDIRGAGLAAFTKKRRFGAAHLEAASIVVKGGVLPYLAQGASRLLVDGRQIEASAINLADLVGAATPTTAP